MDKTNPGLLEELAVWFQQNNFDLRALISLIAKSRAYQLSAVYVTEWKPEYVPYYARKFARRLDAEEIHDAIAQATGVFPEYQPGVGSTLPPVRWAMQFPDTSEPSTNRRVQLFLDGFGRGDRDQTIRSSDGSLLQTLNLMNHSFITSRVRFSAISAEGTISQVLSTTVDPEEIIWQLYLATLSRFPTDDEIAILLPLMMAQGNAQGAASVLWILLNKLDFLFNY